MKGYKPNKKEDVIMENEIKNNEVTVVTEEKKGKKKKEKKPWNWKSFGIGSAAGAGALLLTATLVSMLGGGDNEES